MKIWTLSLFVMLLISGCSTEPAKWTAFEAVQNAKQQECLKQLSPDCPKRESYDEYERKLGELEKK